ncbi:MAG: DPP IV N-terminal domain-containing protein [candidate division Zixibacteria bacterium]|nr:DPP IV N-terminal domain-containing protein [candidate division Zixibacteria bacterium]
MLKKIRYILFAGIILFPSLYLTSGAQDVYFGKNKVQYKGFDWYYIQSEHYDVYYYDLGYNLAEFAANTLEEATSPLGRILNYEVKKRIPVILYNSSSEFQQTNVISELIEENVGGFTEVFKTRVVVPYNGSYEEFRHVLVHELTHAFIFDMLYGNLIGNLLSAEFIQLPLWFAEGFAEYFSRGGWDIEADMILRDATVNGYLIPLEFAGGFLAYKEGQSVINYIVNKYGEEKISEILHKGKSRRSFDKSLKSALGLDQNSLSEEWMKYLRKEYWPEISLRKEPKDFAKQLTDHQKDGSYMNEKPAFSPQGDRLAIFSDRSDYTEIYVISAIDGKKIDKVVKGERTGDLESLHSYVSGLSWSPSGRDITFVSKSKGRDALCLVDVKKKKIYKKFNFNLEAMFSPAWSPDGEKIVFVGILGGRSDLYLNEIKTGKLLRLTEDEYDERDPDWSPDGKSVAFSSDRPSGVEKDSNYVYGAYNIFILEIESKNIEPFTEGGENNFSPAFSPDGKKICFSSSRNGISNLYVQDLDTRRVYPLTDILTGCFSPSWSKNGDQVAFASFYKGGWDIFLLKVDKSLAEDIEPLEKTSFILEKEKRAEVVPDTIKQELSGEGEKKLDFSYYVFKSTQTELDTFPEVINKAIPERETLITKFSTGEYKKKKYKLKFSPDVVSGALSYDTFFGFRGQSFLAITDMFGNHNFYLATDLFNTVDQTNFQLVYLYLPKRIDLGVGIFHTKYYYIDSIDRLFSDRMYGATGLLSLPFSKFSRVELNLTHLSIDRKYYDPNYQGIFEDRSVKVLMSNFAWVRDNVIWGITGPVNGRRSIINFEWSPDISKRSISFTSLWLDYRKYVHFGRNRFGFAFRITSGRSDGENPRQFFLGGMSNWIGPKLYTENVYGVDNLYFSGIITPLRGYEYYELVGTRYFLTNFEFRYPFIEYLSMGFPPIRLRYITGTIFMDMGSAWTETKKFKGGTSKDGTRLKDIKAGFGFGARINLGIFVLRYDAGWKTDFANVSAKPEHYFSLGAEF